MTDIVSTLSPNGERSSTGPAPANVLLVASLHGVVRLERETNGWRTAGTTLGDVHVGSLVRASGKLFAGGHKTGGLWVSDDGTAKNWRRLTNGLKHEHVYSLAAQPLADGKWVLWLGAEPAALYRSDDLGESWRELPGIRKIEDTDKWTFPPPPHIAHVKDITFHPSEPATVYICVEQGALIKSTNGGESWSQLTDYSKDDDIAYRDTHRVAILPSDPKTMFMASGEGLYGSSDGGRHWTHLTTPKDRIGYPDFLFFDPRDERVLYMGGAARGPRYWRENKIADSMISVSRDGGRSWTELSTGLPKPVAGAFEAMGQHASPGAHMITIGTATGEVYASENDGIRWDLIARGLPPVSKDGHYRVFLSQAA
jgi:photosystem II stability/assembly factor-like uncharacterized protein